MTHCWAASYLIPALLEVVRWVSENSVLPKNLLLRNHVKSYPAGTISQKHGSTWIWLWVVVTALTCSICYAHPQNRNCRPHRGAVA